MKKMILICSVLFAQKVLCCADGDTMDVHLGKGIAGKEEIKFVVKGTDGSTKSAKVYDGDGLANLFFITAVAKDTSAKDLNEYKESFLNSLRKAIKIYSDEIAKQTKVISDPATDPLKKAMLQSAVTAYSKAVKDMEALEKDIEKNGLSKKHLGVYTNDILNPLTPFIGFGYSTFQEGNFVKQPKSAGLKEIVGTSTYDSMTSITQDGMVLTARGGCSVKVNPVRSSGSSQPSHSSEPGVR